MWRSNFFKNSLFSQESHHMLRATNLVPCTTYVVDVAMVGRAGWLDVSPS